MSSKKRSDVVLVALKKAGRGVEIKELAEIFLNDVLKDEALRNRYPVLRKTGSGTLATGSSTASVPTDYGAGMENLLMGENRIPLIEKSNDDFTMLNGYRADAIDSTGPPLFYTIDQEAGLIRFNVKADKAYPLVLVYYKLPADIELGAGGDNDYPWYPNDKVLVNLLKAEIFEYVDDERQYVALDRADQEAAKYRRGVFPQQGGSVRVTLNPSRFRNPRRF